MTYKIGALIINWNGTDDTIELLESLQHEVNNNLEINAAVVDNASDITEVNRLKRYIDDNGGPMPIQFKRNRRNIGIPGGYNEAISILGLDYDYYLRLDNDVVILPGGIEILCNALKQLKNEHVILAGGNVKYYDKPNVDNGGAVFVNLLFGKTHIEYPSKNNLCDSILGCVMLIDKKVVKAFYPDIFNNWLFMNTDETELSLHCQRYGWKTLYVCNTIALHKGGQSVKRTSKLSRHLAARNWAYLSLIYIKPKFLLPLVFFRLLFTSLYKLIACDTDFMSATFEGIISSITRR